MKRLSIFLGFLTIVLSWTLSGGLGPLLAQETAVARIHTIQGAGHTSALDGVFVQTVPGIVTDVLNRGFYMQEPEPDEDAATSEGIFVFTSNRPRTVTGETITVGDRVLVSGQVIEFTPGRDTDQATNLSITQIRATRNSDEIVRTRRNQPLPAPIVIGQAGRIPPHQVIDDDGLTTFDVTRDGIDFYESLEGMRVQVDQAQVVNPSSTRGGIIVVGDHGTEATSQTPMGGIIVQANDFNPERIYLRNALGQDPDVQVGDGFEGSLIGVLGYQSGHYQLFVTDPLPNVLQADSPEETTALTSQPEQVTVATYNVENLDPGDGNRFNQIAQHITTDLKAPDILALIEVQDNNGPSTRGTSAADQTYQRLIQAIRAEGGPDYDFTDIAPIVGADGGQPGGNIRVGFLYQPARVSLANRPEGSATEAVEVVAEINGPELSLNPGRIDPNNPAFENSRKSLVAEFSFNGQPIFVIANHFNSKRGDDPLFGRRQPPVLGTEHQRQQQAQVVHDFVAELLLLNPDANVVVLGDMNDFQFSPPLATLEDDLLVNLTDLLPSNEQYSYIFEGNSQQLDHILVSQHPLFEGNAEFDIVHVNAGFTDQVSDHDPLVLRFTIPLTEIPGNGNPESPVSSNPEPSIPITDDSDLFISILPDESGESLVNQLRSLYSPQRSLGYNQGRDLLYSTIDNQDGILEGIYSGYQIELRNSSSPRRDAYNQGINAEHVWPQSLGATGNARSDLHHLFPSRIRVNGVRGSFPFGEINDSQTERWFVDNQEIRATPTTDIDDYSESRNGRFEPREIKKGDVARAIFYFYTIYRSQADAGFFRQQQQTLCQWHQQDPADEIEVERSLAIANSRQGNQNPFILDPTLAARTYCQAML